MASNPYRGLEGSHFWSQAMSWPHPSQIDPMLGDIPIDPGDRVVTMGSCFAQHLARNLASLGLNYHIVETPPAGLPQDEARARNFGVFSARFGNIYTVRQAVQLFERAFGTFAPVDDVWPIQGGFVDALRPAIEPTPFTTPDAVKAAAREHLAHVRTMFREADWLIFTLGLTEAWRSKADGAVYPLAPGVSGGNYASDKYEFVNFSAGEVSADLTRLIELIRAENPRCRVILTVSPVALAATYEKRHVWTATTYSKAALRVAADEAARAYAHVTYFPSYEIITSPAAGGRYYADDLREVTPLGVKHVMRVFKKHFTAARPTTVEVPASRAVHFAESDLGDDTAVVCEEELIERSVRVSTSVRRPNAGPPAPAPVSRPPEKRHAAEASAAIWSRLRRFAAKASQGAVRK